MRRLVAVLMALLFSFSLLVTDSDALVASAVRLPVNTIKQLARLGKTSGSKELGANLIRLSKSFPRRSGLRFLNSVCGYPRQAGPALCQKGG